MLSLSTTQSNCPHCGAINHEEYCMNCGFSQNTIQAVRNLERNSQTNINLLEMIHQFASNEKEIDILSDNEDTKITKATVIIAAVVFSVILLISFLLLHGSSDLVLTLSLILIGAIPFLVVNSLPYIYLFHAQRLKSFNNPYLNILFKQVAKGHYYLFGIENKLRKVINVLNIEKVKQSYVVQNQQLLQTIKELNHDIISLRNNGFNASRLINEGLVAPELLETEKMLLAKQQQYYQKLQEIEFLQWKKFGMQPDITAKLQHKWAERKKRGDYINPNLVARLEQEDLIMHFFTYHDAWYRKIKDIEQRYRQKLSNNIGKEILDCVVAGKDLIKFLASINDTRLNQYNFKVRIEDSLEALDDFNNSLYAANLNLLKPSQYFDEKISLALEKSQELFNLMIEDKGSY